MRTRLTVLCLSVCLFVCYQSPGFFSRLKLDIPACSSLVIPACSSLVFVGFQLTDVDITVSFGFLGAFFLFSVHMNGSVYYLWL